MKNCFQAENLSPAQIDAALSTAAQRVSISGGFEIIRTALTAMQKETQYEALASLALDALSRIEDDWRKS